VDDDDLVQTVVDGLPESWGIFLALVNGREAQPNFDRLWHDCLEEEGRLKSRNELGKNIKKPYPHNNRKSNGILDLIHSDLCGPMTAPSMDGCIYYIIFLLMIVLVKLGFIF
jgi:hypothetical protein